VKRFVCMLALCAAFSSIATDLPVTVQEKNSLTIYSTTDLEAFAPVLRDFHAIHPEIEVTYEELDGAPLYDRFLEEANAGRPHADLLLSSSMDLQVKLVNDGYAAPHVSDNTRALPVWARWRNEAFGFTFEPVVMVFNRDAMQGRSLPTSRSELQQLLTREPAIWRGRVGTYDVMRNGVGYLLASQDARQSSEFNTLIDAFGLVQAEIDERTATLLDHLESGRLAIGYNLLATYAQSRVERGAPLSIVYPEDYTLAVARTAVISGRAPHAEAAHLFLDYLLSLRGQQVLASRSRLFAARQEIQGPLGRMGITGSQVRSLRPITLGPGLLVYLDDQKMAGLRSRWRQGINHLDP
jgi:iron(III) transport system substrate-binding protein